MFERAHLTPRQRLLAAFDVHSPLCPFIAAAVEIPDPGHPARVHARDYKNAFAARLTETAREAGATHPEQLGEQLALLDPLRQGFEHRPITSTKGTIESKQ